jgi:hypothetical protein
MRGLYWDSLMSTVRMGEDSAQWYFSGVILGANIPQSM